MSEVPTDGYRWWYVDAVSDDGNHGLTVIAFIGSVFSPYYAWARRRGHGDPYNHCALNVALYGRKPTGWMMTERGRQSLQLREDRLTIGPSSLYWNGSELTIEFDEITVPIPKRVRGSLTVKPEFMTPVPYALDETGRHLWWPIAPRSAVTLELDNPEGNWTGQGYLDSNWGEAPLETDFIRWNWSRTHTDGGATVFYDLSPRSGAENRLALAFGPSGTHAIEAPPRVKLARSKWGIPRETRADAESRPVVQQSLEDAPFYARSLVGFDINGVRLQSIHESLNLDRFASPFVQWMLPFRMPRRSA